MLGEIQTSITSTIDVLKQMNFRTVCFPLKNMIDLVSEPRSELWSCHLLCFDHLEDFDSGVNVSVSDCRSAFVCCSYKVLFISFFSFI